MNEEKTLRVSEIFGPTIQGEGEVMGLPTVFVRLGGCDDRCTWCDSLHAVDSQFRNTWIKMTTEEIIRKINELSGGVPILISLSGGNPAIQDCEDLIISAKKEGFGVALETQGTIARSWFKHLNRLTISPKPPSSGNITQIDKVIPCILAAEGTKVALKFAILDTEDLDFAEDMTKELKKRGLELPVTLQPVNHTPPTGDENNAISVDIEAINARMRWLVDETIKRKWYAAKVLPQLHVMLWGNQRGV